MIHFMQIAFDKVTSIPFQLANFFGNGTIGLAAAIQQDPLHEWILLVSLGSGICIFGCGLIRLFSEGIKLAITVSELAEKRKKQKIQNPE